MVFFVIFNTEVDERQERTVVKTRRLPAFSRCGEVDCPIEGRSQQQT
jgi:hypothetical protein